MIIGLVFGILNCYLMQWSCVIFLMFVLVCDGRYDGCVDVEVLLIFMLNWGGLC